MHIVNSRLIRIAFPPAIALLLLTATSALAQEEELFKVDPKKVRADIEGFYKEVDRNLSRNRIAEARQVIELIKDRIEKHRKIFTRDERDFHKTFFDMFQETITKKVDSLTQVNLEILEKKGAIEAIEFRTYLASRVGLSEAELMRVDDAIIRFGPSEQQQQQREQEIVEEAYAAVEMEIEPEHIEDQQVKRVARRVARVREDSLKALKARQDSIAIAREDSIMAEEARQDSIAQAREDSVMAEKARQDSIAHALEIQRAKKAQLEENRKFARSAMYKIEMLIEEGKAGEAHTVFRIYKANLEQNLDRRTFASLKGRLEAAYEGFEQRSAQVAALSGEIFALVKQGNAREAHLRFQQNRRDLQLYLEKSEFALLKTEVLRLYETWRKNVEQAVAYADEITALINEERAEKAYKQFVKNRNFIQRYLLASVFDELRIKVDKAYRDILDKKEWANVCARDVELLLEERKGLIAHQRFEEFRPDLSAYLSLQRYERLETDVEQAYNAFLIGAEKSKTAVKKLNEFLETRQVPLAYASFNKMEDSLKHYLDDTTFVQLKARIRSLYSESQEGTASASKLKRQIWSLIESRQGIKAYALFIESSGTLKEYLKPADYETLQSAAIDAKNDYEQNRARMRAEAARIQKLLEQNRIVDAHDALERSKENLEHYLDNAEQYYALEQDVENAYGGLQDKRKDILQTQKRIQLLIDRDEGAEAFKIYEGAKVELEKFLPASEFASLRTDVVKANVSFRNNRAKAGFAADHILGLITKKNTLKAYARFRSIRSELKHYLPEDDYNSLEDAVVQAYDQMQDSKREALQVARKIRAMVANRDGMKAYELFELKKDELSKYLNPEDFGDISKIAERGRIEYEQGVAKAEVTATAIEELLADKKAQIAYARFDAEKDELELYLDKDFFLELEKRVDQAYRALQDKQRNALDAAHRINVLIKKKQGRQALVLFKKNAVALDKYLPQQSFKQLRSRATVAAREFDEREAEARVLADRLESMVSRDSIDAAHALFMQNRANLQHYLDEKEYSSVEVAVSNPYGRYRKKRREAKWIVYRLKRMIRWGKVAQAHEESKKHRASLAKYLSPEEYTDIRVKVRDSYKAYVKRQRAAQNAYKRIEALVALDQIEKAYELFYANRRDLKQYIESGKYAELESRVLVPYQDLKKNTEDAEAEARAIESLLQKGSAWEAYERFRKERHRLKKYLDNERYEALEQKVYDANKGK